MSKSKTTDLPSGWPLEWPRKSKFDIFILKGPSGVFGFTWDTAVSGVAEWNHTDGKVWWRKSGNDYRAKALKKYELIQRLPEWYGRIRDGGPGLMKCVQEYALAALGNTGKVKE